LVAVVDGAEVEAKPKAVSPLVSGVNDIEYLM
jgi:hypothetical protein